MRKKSVGVAALGAVMGLQLAFGPLIGNAAGSDAASDAFAVEATLIAESGDAATGNTDGAGVSGPSSISGAIEPHGDESESATAEHAATTELVGPTVTEASADFDYYDWAFCYLDGVYYWPCWGNGDTENDEAGELTKEFSATTSAEARTGTTAEQTASAEKIYEPAPVTSESDEPTVVETGANNETVLTSTSASGAEVTFDGELEISGNHEGEVVEWNVVIPAPSQDVANTTLEITRSGGNWGFDKKILGKYEFGPGITVVSVKNDLVVLSIDNLVAGEVRSVTIPGLERGNDGKINKASVRISGAKDSFSLTGQYELQLSTENPSTTVESSTAEATTEQVSTSASEPTAESSVVVTFEKTTEQTSETTSKEQTSNSAEPTPDTSVTPVSSVEPTPSAQESSTTEAVTSTVETTHGEITAEETSTVASFAEESSTQEPFSSLTSTNDAAVEPIEEKTTSLEATSRSALATITTEETGTEDSIGNEDTAVANTNNRRSRTAQPQALQSAQASTVALGQAETPVAPAQQPAESGQPSTGDGGAAPADQPSDAQAERDSANPDSALADAEKSDSTADTVIAASQPAPGDLAEIHSIREADQGDRGIPPVDIALNVVAFTVLIGGAVGLYRLLKL